MKRHIAVLSALGALAAVSAQAQLVYDNGPINGTVDAWSIAYFQVSDSFTVASGTSLGSAQVGMWEFPGDSMTSVSWEIGTTPFGSDISSGTSSVNNGTFALNGAGYDIGEDTFSINGSVSAGTTYYFTLFDASVVPNGDNIYWDENDGPSTASQTTTGTLPGSESFQLYANGVPDGGTTAMLLTGGLSLLAFIKRKLS